MKTTDRDVDVIGRGLEAVMTFPVSAGGFSNVKIALQRGVMSEAIFCCFRSSVNDVRLCNKIRLADAEVENVIHFLDGLKDSYHS